MSNWKKDFQNEITIEDLPDEFQTLAGIIGMEATLLFMNHFAGM